MADLSKIKVGDRLRIEVEVQEMRDEPLRIRVRPAHNQHGWLWPDIESSAEHIPAPKTFKRGDWVRESPNLGTLTGGIVTWAINRSVTVHWPNNISATYSMHDLESDEAPDA